MTKDNPYQAVIKLRKVGKSLGQLADAFTKPIPDDVLRYKGITLNTKSGLCEYRGVGTYLQKHKNPYKILVRLISEPEIEVSYQELCQICGLEHNKKNKGKIRAAIHGIRRSLKISRAQNSDIFISSGNGFSLIT